MRPLALATLMTLAACSGTQPPSPVTTPPSVPRVAIVVMENKEYGSVIGNTDAPYVNSLARRSAIATSFFATARPSFPNYLALTGGDTFGITTNCTDCHVGAHSLVDQLEGAGISWKAYMEGMPKACFLGIASGRYVKRHNPFVYYDRIVGDPDRCAKVVPLTELDTDLATGDLPRFVWITPDNCHNTHDCSVAVGDRFLSRLLPPVLRALGPRGVLFLTYDEGSTDRGCCRYAKGGHIVTIVAGPGARPGRYAQPLDHYSILRAIEDRWDLARLGRAASPETPEMDGLLNDAG